MKINSILTKIIYYYVKYVKSCEVLGHYSNGNYSKRQSLSHSHENTGANPSL